MRKILYAACVAILAAGAAGCATPKADGPVVAAINPCSDLTVSIYFERDSVSLTREAREVLGGAAEQASGCSIGSVEVYGLADPVGSPKANLAISDARAKVVTAELTRLGVTDVHYRMVAAGETDAITPQGDVRPLRRRADVIFRLARAG